MGILLQLPGCELFYRVDDFTDPWTQPETVLLLHGNAESSQSWYAWVPVLARQLRVVRPDMRIFRQTGAGAKGQRKRAGSLPPFSS